MIRREILGMHVTVSLEGFRWRPLTDSEGDTGFVVQMRNDPQFARMFYNSTITPEQHKKFIRGADERDEINWLIENDSDSQPMGLASIYNIDRTNRKAECGRMVMLRPKLFHLNWMVSIFVGFEVLGLYRMFIETLEQNEIVARGCERMGMTREGLLRGHVFRDGKSVNVWMLGGTADEWFAPGTRAKYHAKWGEPKLISFDGSRVDVA